MGAASQLGRGQQQVVLLRVFCVLFIAVCLFVLSPFSLSLSPPPHSLGLEMWIYWQVNPSGHSPTSSFQSWHLRMQ